MSSYSHRRSKRFGDITPPTERVNIDPVTGEMIVTPLDGVQLAFESVRRWYETAAARHNLTLSERERLADLVLVMVLKTKRHTERDIEALLDLLHRMN